MQVKQVKIVSNLVNHKQSKQKFIDKMNTFPETSVILKVYDSSESAVSFARHSFATTLLVTILPAQQLTNSNGSYQLIVGWIPIDK